MNFSTSKRTYFSHELNPTCKSFLAGSLSGSCSAILFQPFDLVKTRLQTCSLQTNGVNITSSRIVPLVYQVVRDEKIIGLWRGTTPSLIRCAPGVGLYFCSLEWVKQHLCHNRKPKAHENLCIGVIARSFSVAVLLPVTVVKTRYESGIFSYNSVSGAIRHTYISEGARGLFSGLAPTLMRDAPFSGLYFMFFSQMKTLVLPHSPSNSTSITSLLTFMCGLNAGLMASVVTHPMDVVKTRMQVYPREFSSLISTILLILKANGFKGMFRGLLPRMVRRTLVAAMSWTVYEQLMANIGLK